MEARSKWLWAITLGNIAVTSLLLVSISSIVLALAALAPVISGWPLYILLPLGLALSITSLRLKKSVLSRISRLSAFAINSCALALDALIILGVAVLFLGSTKERFLIPDGYKGDIYVLYGLRDGEILNQTKSQVTYRIQSDGILRTQGLEIPRWTRTEYYYEKQDGSLERIHNEWLTTVHPTPDNLADDKDFGVYFPRTGSLTDSAGCSVRFQQFYVGTKAHLLSEYKENNLVHYLRDHPGACSSRP